MPHASANVPTVNVNPVEQMVNAEDNTWTFEGVNVDDPNLESDDEGIEAAIAHSTLDGDEKEDPEPTKMHFH